MTCKVKLLVVSVNTFKSKDKTKNYFMAQCLTPEMENNDYFYGYQVVKFFIDEIAYNSLVGSFKPLQEYEFKMTVSGDKVKYSL